MVQVTVQPYRTVCVCMNSSFIIKAALNARIYIIIGITQIVRNVMAYNIYHIYITNIKDNGVIESVHIRLNKSIS
jgi:hypothetical protein